jgi:transposase-like protein
MPWREASPMDQRTQFIADYLRDALAITELCEHYGVSRKTGYKWIERYLRHGPAGLEERSRRPRRSPNETAEEIVTAILAARRRHPAWGGKKLLALLHKRHPRWSLSFAKTPSGEQMVDLSALIRRKSQPDDHPPAPSAPTPPVPVRRPPPAGPREPRLAATTGRLQADGEPAQASTK